MNVSPTLTPATLDARCLSDVLECAVLLVVQQKHAPVETHGQIGRAVIVVVARCAADRVNGRIQPGLLRHIFKLAIAQVVIQRHPALRTVVGQKNVRLAVAVIIKKARARPEE